MKATTSVLSTKTSFLVAAVALLVLLFAVQQLFWLLQENEADRVLDGAVSVFRSEDIGTNPYRISAELVDMAERRLLRCPHLTMANQTVYLDRSDLQPCVPSFWKLHGAWAERPVVAINGETWKVSALIPNSPFFYVALWTSRGLSLLAVAFGLFLYLTFTAKMELQRRHSEQIESLTKQVAHDLRSPLSAINMVVAKAGLEKGMAQLAGQAVQRLNQIAEDVLHWKPANRFNSVEIDSLVKDLVAEKKMEWGGQKPVAWQVKLAAPECLAQGPGSDVARIISNILNNSFDALPETGGQIEIVTRIEQNQLRLLIEDNGKGIPSEVLKKVGEKGFSFGKKGTGLGLYSAKNQVTSWGGHLRVDSTLGSGTRVEIIFQIA